MRNHSRAFIQISIVGIVVALSIFCVVRARGREAITETPPPFEQHSVETVQPLALWTVYWNVEDLPEGIQTQQAAMNTLSFFAASFDTTDNVWIPKQTTNALGYVQHTYPERGWKHYLTIVNDCVKLDGGVSLKDTQLLQRLFKDKQVMAKHIENVIEVALEGGYEGIEIDYEGIGKDRELWKQFSLFCESLYHEATQKNLTVRVLLEAGAPLDKIQLPQGPEYGVMCYNLHGYGTEAGPKATDKWLQEIVEKAKNIPGEKVFILPKGGFAWAKSGQGEAITQREATQRQTKYAIKVIRDEESQALHYTYQDTEGESYVVWYADEKTLIHWKEVLKKRGVEKLGVWYIGG